MKPELRHKLYPWLLLAAIVAAWHIASVSGAVPAFMLPSPADVIRAAVDGFPEIIQGAGVTLAEAMLGLLIGCAVAFAAAVAMDASTAVHSALYPILVVTQAIPTVAVAPLLVLWMGYGIEPKIALVALVCFFPLAVSLLGGLKSADPDAAGMLRAMGAGRLQIFRHIKLPYAMQGLFSGLRVAVTYSIVGGVIAEWLGGTAGLGVYMTRVRKAYAFDKMFAVILIIVIISLILIKLVDIAEKRAFRWRKSGA